MKQIISKAEQAQQLNSILSKFIGQMCWEVHAGYGTGTHISFDLGQKIARGVRRSKKVTGIETFEIRYTGEFSLYSECSWRLDADEDVVLTCWTHTPDERGFNRAYIELLGKLKGAKVISFDLRSPGWDLDLTFDNGLTLRLFCDQPINEEDATNYILADGDLRCFVGAQSSVSVLSGRLT